MDKLSHLDARVLDFMTLSLPGQPQFMHMGTSYLVNDLDRARKSAVAERDALRAALRELMTAFDDAASHRGVRRIDMQCATDKARALLAKYD
jgi:hypothetical protein